MQARGHVGLMYQFGTLSMQFGQNMSIFSDCGQSSIKASKKLLMLRKIRVRLLPMPGIEPGSNRSCAEPQRYVLTTTLHELFFPQNLTGNHQITISFPLITHYTCP